MKSSKALEYLSNIRFLSDSMVLVCTKIQIRTIVLEYKMRAHIISPREGSNLFNVVILLAFKALLLDFLDLWGYKMDQQTHRLGLCRKGSVYLPKIKLYSFFGSPVKFYFLRFRTIYLDQLWYFPSDTIMPTCTTWDSWLQIFVWVFIDVDTVLSWTPAEATSSRGWGWLSRQKA